VTSPKVSDALPTRIRTWDLSLVKGVLYPLSYRQMRKVVGFPFALLIFQSLWISY
jgi:hypothetical protein